MIEETVQAQIEYCEKKFQDAGYIRLDPDSKEYKEYITTKTKLEELQTRIKEEPLKVVAEFQSAANPSTVSRQTNMLNVDTGDMDLKKRSDNLNLEMITRQCMLEIVILSPKEDITKMTIDEVHDLQTDYLNHQNTLGYPVGLKERLHGCLSDDGRKLWLLKVWVLIRLRRCSTKKLRIKCQIII